jgi:hypothetical protein
MVIVDGYARIALSLLVLMSAISVPAFGEGLQPSEAEHKDVGKIRTWSQKYDQALGAVSEYARSSEGTIACSGICYFPSGVSRPITWTCSPKTSCNLLCRINPPAGSCSGGSSQLPRSEPKMPAR